MSYIFRIELHQKVNVFTVKANIVDFIKRMEFWDPIPKFHNIFGFLVLFIYICYLPHSLDAISSYLKYFICNLLFGYLLILYLDIFLSRKSSFLIFRDIFNLIFKNLCFSQPIPKNSIFNFLSRVYFIFARCNVNKCNQGRVLTEKRIRMENDA